MVLNWLVGSIPFELKLDDISYEEMGYILNDLGYLYVGSHSGDLGMYYMAPGRPNQLSGPW